MLVGERFGVCLPAGLLELDVDELSCRRFVEVELLGLTRGLGSLDDHFQLGRRGVRGLLLEGSEVGRPFRLGGGRLLLGLLRQLEGGLELGIGCALGFFRFGAHGRFQLGGFGLALRLGVGLVEFLTEALELGVEEVVFFRGVRRWNELPDLQIGLVAKAPQKPHREGAGHAELMERLTPRGRAVVRGLVALAAKIVEEVRHLTGENPPVGQATEQVELAVAGIGVEACGGGGFLGQQFAELPKPHERGDRVFKDVSLGRERRLEERRAAFRQKTEVRRDGLCGFGGRGGHGSKATGLGIGICFWQR